MKKPRKSFGVPWRGIVGLCLVCFLVSGGLRILGSSVAYATDRIEPSEAALATERPNLDELNVLIAALSAREDELDARQQALTTLEGQLAEAQRAIAANLADLEAAEQRLATRMADSNGASDADIGQLTQVYQSMKPKAAADLFTAMAPEFAAEFLVRMTPDGAAAVFSNLEPDVAYALSAVIAGRNALAATE